MDSWRTAVVLAATLLLAACAASDAEDDADPADGTPTGVSVTGQWCGRDVSVPAECLGDEVGYLELEQSGNSVSGNACEDYESDCYAIENGSVAGDELTFQYSWSEDATTYTVTGDFLIGPDGSQLSGVYHSTKCDCDIPRTFERL